MQIMPKYSYNDLVLVEPTFGSKLTDLIIELDYLRRKKISGTTHYMIFFQIKEIFHMLESIGSARIEGNRTTIAEFIETKFSDDQVSGENIKEIKNMENALDFIDKTITGTNLTNAYIYELHKKVVKDLAGDGSQMPGRFRNMNVTISQSSHTPPDYTQVDSYMEELLNFINQDHPSKYDLLKTAIAHHRLVWIHPFDNGNGRVVRLFTYAMLVKQGFNINIGKIINPTAVFCNDRDKYYQMLSLADDGQSKNVLKWCEYVLSGLKNEMTKIDKLLDYHFMIPKILVPAIKSSLNNKLITENESKILILAAKEQVIQACNIKRIIPNKAPAEISRMIKRLIEKKMLVSEKKHPRKYLINFGNNFLLRGIIEALNTNGFLPMNDT